MLVKGKILEWGNSFGLRLNKAAAISAGLRADEEVEVEVKRKVSTGRDLWGKLKRKGNTEKILEEIDRDFQEY
jgi:antitoxin component of MazEF toxin-antitoxin module